MKKKIIFTFLVFVIVAGICFIFDNMEYQETNKNIAANNSIEECNNNITNNKVTYNETKQNQENSIKEDKNSNNSNIDTDGKQTTYTFIYKNETYSAILKNGCWKIIDSYKIKDTKHIKVICQALIDIHPVLGKDRISYRTAEDMVYEWVQHNLAYSMLSEESEFKGRAKDVDLDPDDQGKSFIEIYEDRTGKKIKF